MRRCHIYIYIYRISMEFSTFRFLEKQQHYNNKLGHVGGARMHVASICDRSSKLFYLCFVLLVCDWSFKLSSNGR